MLMTYLSKSIHSLPLSRLLLYIHEKINTAPSSNNNPNIPIKQTLKIPSRHVFPQPNSDDPFTREYFKLIDHQPNAESNLGTPTHKSEPDPSDSATVYNVSLNQSCEPNTK